MKSLRIALLAILGLVVFASGCGTYDYATKRHPMADGSSVEGFAMGRVGFFGTDRDAGLIYVSPSPGATVTIRRTEEKPDVTTTGRADRVDPRCGNLKKGPPAECTTTLTGGKTTIEETRSREGYVAQAWALGNPSVGNSLLPAAAMAAGYMGGQALRRPTRINQNFRLNAEANVDNSGGGGDCDP